MGTKQSSTTVQAQPVMPILTDKATQFEDNQVKAEADYAKFEREMGEVQHQPFSEEETKDEGNPLTKVKAAEDDLKMMIGMLEEELNDESEITKQSKQVEIPKASEPALVKQLFDKAV